VLFFPLLKVYEKDIGMQLNNVGLASAGRRSRWLVVMDKEKTKELVFGNGNP